MSSRSSHRADIEGLRAIAVILVLLYHAGITWFGGGYLGVDVFFVISGFLITKSLVEEAERNGRVRLGNFYARRVRRLLPAAAVVIAATAAAVRFALPPTMWRDFGGDLIGAAAYVLNWRLAARSVDYLAEDVAASPVQHFWSLSIEEQFYFVWPALILLALFIAARRRWRVRAVMGWLLLLVVTVPSFAWSAATTPSSPSVAFFDTRTRMWELALGGLVAIALPQLPEVGTKTATLVKTVAVAVVIGFAIVLDETAAWPGMLALGATLPTAVLLGLGEREGSSIDRVLATTPMQQVGAWSYSLYLWHWPPLAILAAAGLDLTTWEAAGVTLLSIIPAVLSYRLLENPVRFHPSLRRSPAFSLSVGFNLTLVGGLAGLLVLGSVAAPMTPANVAVGGGVDAAGGQAAAGPLGAVALPENPSDEGLLATLDGVTSIIPSAIAATDDIPRSYDQGCHARDTAEPIVCEFGAATADATIALVGDSKAAQWMSAFDGLASERGWQLLMVTKSACPLTTAEPALDEADAREQCQAWGEATIDVLSERRPDLVLVSQVASRAFGEEREEAQDRLVAGMLEAYRRIEENGSPVAILMDNPQPSLVVYECVAEHPDALELCTFERNLSSGGRFAQMRAASEGGFPVVETVDLVCPTETCLPVIGGVLVYRQGSHITDTYIRTTQKALGSRVAPLVDTV